MVAYRVGLDGVVVIYYDLDNLVRLSEDHGHLCGLLGGRDVVLARDCHSYRHLVLWPDVPLDYPILDGIGRILGNVRASNDASDGRDRIRPKA